MSRLTTARKGRAYTLLFTAVAGSVVLAETAPTLDLRVGVGEVSYQENVTVDPTKSKWDASFVSLDGEFFTQAESLVLGLLGSVWLSGDDTETWRMSGEVAQRNDLRVAGLDLLAELGVAVVDQPGLRIVPAAGIGLNVQHFERSDVPIVVDGSMTERISVDETFVLSFFNGSITVVQELTEKVEARFRGGAGYVFFYEADNEVLGQVDGDGGTVFEAGAGLTYRFNEAHAVGLGFVYALQDLDGDVEDRLFRVGEDGLLPGFIELPDNELERIAVEASWRVAL